MTKYKYNDVSLAQEAREDVISIIEKIDESTALDRPLSVMLALVDRLAFLIANNPVIVGNRNRSKFCAELLESKVSIYEQRAVYEI